MGDDAEFPPLPDGEYLHEWLMDAGPTCQTGMGNVPLSRLEIDAWGAGFAGHEDKVAVRRLSGEYAYMQQEAQKADCPAPYVTREVAQRQAAQGEAAVRKAFDGMIGQGSKRRVRR